MRARCHWLGGGASAGSAPLRSERVPGDDPSSSIGLRIVDRSGCPAESIEVGL